MRFFLQLVYYIIFFFKWCFVGIMKCFCFFCLISSNYQQSKFNRLTFSSSFIFQKLIHHCIYKLYHTFFKSIWVKLIHHCIYKLYHTFFKSIWVIFVDVCQILLFTFFCDILKFLQIHNTIVTISKKVILFYVSRREISLYHTICR